MLMSTKRCVNKRVRVICTE